MRKQSSFVAGGLEGELRDLGSLSLCLLRIQNVRRLARLLNLGRGCAIEAEHFTEMLKDGLALRLHIDVNAGQWRQPRYLLFQRESRRGVRLRGAG